jgi:transportin-1
MRHAYDALLTLASSVHTALAEPTILPLFLPQLLAKWQALGDDREQLQLLETLTAVIPCLGVAFQPYAAPVFQRCMAMAQQQLQYKQAGESAGPEYEPEFLVRLPLLPHRPRLAHTSHAFCPLVRCARWMW